MNNLVGLSEKYKNKFIDPYAQLALNDTGVDGMDNKLRKGKLNNVSKHTCL